MIPGYVVSSNSDEMDLTRIHSNISKSYWSSGVPIETLKVAIENSLCFGVFTLGRVQVGFGRMVTDYATFAYLADVYIEEAHQGKGLSKWLMKEIHDHPSLQGLRRILLATKDAHGLYKKFGYTELDNPSVFMEKWDRNVYSK